MTFKTIIEETLLRIWYVIKMIVFLMCSVLFFLVAVFVRIFNFWEAISIFKKCLHLFHWMFGLKITYEFAEEESINATNTVFVLLNQTSFLDSMIVPVLPVQKLRGIINIEFGLYPILGWFLMMSNFVIVRQWSSQAKRTLNRTSNFLKNGGNMAISIEGKRSENGQLNEYKKGPIVMAINNQSDIIPFIISGTYESLPMKSLYAKPQNIKVQFLTPISTIGLTYDDRDDLKNQLLEVAHANDLN